MTAPASTALPQPNLSFALCVESGPLEPMSVLLVRSLRKWGGTFANCPVFAVTPRFGPALSSQTLREFERVGVRYIRFRRDDAYRWYTFLNKPTTLLAVEKACETESIAFLDGDMLVADEPTSLRLAGNEDFTGCVPDVGIGSTGSDDPRDLFWQRCAAAAGVDIGRMPLVLPQHGGVKIRLYWNAGCFAYRISSGFARAFKQATLRMLDARIAHHEKGVHFFEQVAMSLIVGTGNYRWRVMNEAYNFTINPRNDCMLPLDLLRQVKVIHYHEMMMPEHRADLLKMLQQYRPELAEWLGAQGELVVPNSLLQRTLRFVLRALRARKREAHLAKSEKL